ncbi:MAG TPA: hypothetical protein VN283_01385 [Thiobacillus sp.]|nr:hypothetical protein [Thiobacillus sp.]
MADDTKKPAEAKPTTPVARTAAAASAKSSAPKPAARPRAAAAPAARRRPSATAKAATLAVKKTATRPPVARKSPPVKKAAHEPEPFVAKDNKADKPAKAKKAKLVRDSFTMPDLEYALIAALKKRCLNAGVSAKKSEILRAAVANLAKLSDASVVAAVRRLDVIKTGRPAKGSK